MARTPVPIELEDGTEQTVNVRSPTEAEKEEIWTAASKNADADGQEFIIASDGLRKAVKKVAIACSDISEEEYNQLPCTETEKINTVIERIGLADLDFSRRLSRVRTS